MGGRAGFGGEDHEALAGVVGAVPGVAVEGEVTDQAAGAPFGFLNPAIYKLTGIGSVGKTFIRTMSRF